MTSPRSQRTLPNYVQDKVVDEDDFFTDPWQQFFSQLQSYIQSYLSDEGYVTPSQTLKNMAVIRDAKDAQGNKTCLPGTQIFASDEVNGGTTDKPNGQLYILLNDGNFHKITNT